MNKNSAFYSENPILTKLLKIYKNFKRMSNIFVFYYSDLTFFSVWTGLVWSCTHFQVCSSSQSSWMINNYQQSTFSSKWSTVSDLFSWAPDVLSSSLKMIRPTQHAWFCRIHLRPRWGTFETNRSSCIFLLVGLRKSS